MEWELFNGYRISVFRMKRVIEMDCDNGFTTLSMYLILLNCTLKIVKVVNLCYVYFPRVKKMGKENLPQRNSKLREYFHILTLTYPV